MKDTFLSARLVEKDLIRLSIFSFIPYEDFETKLLIDNAESILLKPTKQVSTTDFKLSKPLELGHNYDLVMPSRAIIPLDVIEATTFSNFDDEYYYDGDDLGSTWSKDKTSFVLWAPLASSVCLLYRRSGEEWSAKLMERTERGVYRTTLSGDCDLYEYKYLVTNSGNQKPAIDPYAKASTPNGEASVVMDMSRFNDIADFRCNLEEVKSPIIYEADVRDMTNSSFSDVVSKSTFKGLSEPGRKTKMGSKAGFDYIKSLNITHLQLLPIFDFKTVDELDPKKKYNWGYDPQQYFVPEGSYCSNVSDPSCRIRECKEMIEAYRNALGIETAYLITRPGEGARVLYQA
mgnify:CR=1 FL=1